MRVHQREITLSEYGEMKMQFKKGNTTIDAESWLALKQHLAFKDEEEEAKNEMQAQGWVKTG